MRLPRHCRACAATAALLSIVGAGPGLGQSACVVPSELALVRPDPEGVPTEVKVGAYLVDLYEIDSAEQTFSADLFLFMSWRDERLLNLEEGSLVGCWLPLAVVWSPVLNIVNERDVSRDFEEGVRLTADGRLEYGQRLRGRFTATLDLREFPMDSQRLAIHVVLGQVESDEIEFVRDERTGQAERLSIADWTVVGSSVAYESYYLAPADRYLPQVSYWVDVQRNRAYYAQKVFLPLILIVCMSWAVFWIDPKLVPPQIGIATSAVLTLVAFLFSLAYTLPRLSYLTRADRFVMGSMVLVFFAFGEALLSTGLAGRGRETVAVRIDRISRFAFPAAFLAVLLYALVL